MANSVLERVKVEIDEELWYGASSDEVAEAEASKSMAARMGRIVGAKPFPAAAHRLSQITQDPNCQMDEVVSVLESDPALSARLLRLVNSVGFSLRTACTSVRHAAALVGTEKLHQVASTAAILDMYESGGDRARDLLEHATVVGTLCRYLAFHFGLPPDELFTCGFLHDIGKLMLLDTEGKDYLDLLGTETSDFDLTHIEERKRYGFDHALLAGHVLAAWNIPHPVPKVVAWHHHVTRAYAESTTISQMVSTLRLADAMSYALRREDTQTQVENLARMEAASYMDISEGQIAAMWDEVKALTERARAIFRGEKVEDVIFAQSSRPSGASMRAVARARNSERVSRLSGTSLAPASERVSLSANRQFPCVACGAPSYAHRCAACHGYMCPLHVANEAEWCQLCQAEYEEAGIPSIRPLVSTLIGALAGGLVAAAFFGAASAGAQRPLHIMIGPTLMLMLLGMLAGVGQRWVRRWWFLRSRPSRASIVPKAVEALLDTAALQNPQIVEIESPPIIDSSFGAGPDDGSPSSPHIEPLSLMNPEIPAPPALPQMVMPQASLSQVEAPTLLSAPPPSIPPLSSPPRSASRSRPPGERHWMSSGRTPPPPGVDAGSGLESLPTPPAPAEPFALASLPARSGSAQPFVRTPSALMERTLFAEPPVPRHTLAGPGPGRPPNDAAPAGASNDVASNDVAESDVATPPVSTAPVSSEVSSSEAPLSEAPVSDVMATDREALDADVESVEELSAARASGGARGSVRPAASLRSTGSERPASYPSRAGERAVARSRASGAPRVGRGTSSAPPASQRPRSSTPAPSSTRAKVAPRPLQPRPAVSEPPLPAPPAVRLDSVAAPNSDPAMLPIQSIPPQNDAKDAAPRSGWSSVIDEGTAGGW